MKRSFKDTEERCKVCGRRIQNVIDYLSKQYCQGDGSLGWQKGYSPEERIRTAVNMLKKLV